jgi:hypothetical protein
MWNVELKLYSHTNVSGIINGDRKTTFIKVFVNSSTVKEAKKNSKNCPDMKIFTPK